jgi:hypothetical protein
VLLEHITNIVSRIFVDFDAEGAQKTTNINAFCDKTAFTNALLLDFRPTGAVADHKCGEPTAFDQKL